METTAPSVAVCVDDVFVVILDLPAEAFDGLYMFWDSYATALVWCALVEIAYVACVEIPLVQRSHVDLFFLNPAFGAWEADKSRAFLCLGHEVEPRALA